MEVMTIGQRIASRRKLANLSQENLSEQLGVSRQAISKWESDVGLPDIDNLIALSKIFGVSVGWLLGTEQDPNFDPSTGLSDAQLRMVEELVAKRRPKHRFLWLNIALAAVIVAQGVIFPLRMAKSMRETDEAKQSISALQQQMDGINTTLEQQKKEKGMLLNVHVQAYLKDEQTCSITFYLMPKLYQQNAQAYLVILNESEPYYEKIQLECHRVGEFYRCIVDLPLKNGYSYSFILAGESGFQEQKLGEEWVTGYLEDLYDATRYHLIPEAEERTLWDVRDTEYVFDGPIASPFVRFRDLYVGYEAIDVTLYHNGTPIHTESLREAFRDHGGAYMISEEPLIPNIKAQLPTLTVGDTLRLEISAKSYNGKTLSNVLEELKVVDDTQSQSNK